MAPRFPHTITLIRPVLGSDGDYTFPAGTTLKGAVFRRRLKELTPGVGDTVIVTAQGFLPVGTDVQLGDRITRGTDRWVVVSVVDAEDDRGVVDHVGVELGPVGS